MNCLKVKREEAGDIISSNEIDFNCSSIINTELKLKRCHCQREFPVFVEEDGLFKCISNSDYLSKKRSELEGKEFILKMYFS